MANFQLDAESAMNDLLDQIALVQREKAAIQMQLNAALRALDEAQNKEGEGTDGGNTV